MTLATFYADCVPLFFIDPVNRAVGLSHSGWRGTVGRMGARTLEVMEKQYGTNPESVYAAIGPSICQKCYEVSGDVAEQFLARICSLPGGQNPDLQKREWKIPAESVACQ